MIDHSLMEIATGLSGKLIGNNQMVNAVLTDSRNIGAESSNLSRLFIALKGPNFDAHQFIEKIATKVTAVVVEHQCEIDIPQIIVKDSRKALAKMAAMNRAKSSAKYVAITGSSGKTTVKEMIACILSSLGKTHATSGNLNNDIGAPITLLGVDSDTEYAVIELGANHKGEIAYTSEITQPDVAIVNNVSEAHLQGFGDIRGVASAKSEIYLSLSRDGTAVLNADENFYNFFADQVKCHTLSFSAQSKQEIFASDIVQNKDQSTHFILNYQNQKQAINLPLVGQHNISNALAAAACTIALSVPLNKIAEGLNQTPVIPGRLVVSNLNNACTLIDDTYNANVSSMLAAIKLLSQYQGKKILVIGDMAELGEQARKYHDEIGVYAKDVGIDILYTCGELTQFSQQAFTSSKNELNENHFFDQKQLIIKLTKEAIRNVTVLVKGSRSAHMEDVVKAILEKNNQAQSVANDIENKTQRTASLKGDY